MQTSAPVMKRVPYNYGYGYMWWLWKNNEDVRLKNAFSAFGAYGQSITVFPEMETIVVFNTKVEYGRANSGLTTQVLPKKVLDFIDL
jgi:CubicO group peptidase (beta-lactamase class C family)